MATRGLLSSQPQQQPMGLLGANFHQPMTGHSPQVQQWLVAQGHAPASSMQTFGQASTAALNLPPWATREQIDARLSDNDPTAARLQGGNPQIRDAVLGSVFPHFNTKPAEAEAPNEGGGGNASRGMFPNAPFTPFPTGMQYEEGRKAIQDQAREAFDWLRSRLPTVQR